MGITLFDRTNNGNNWNVNFWNWRPIVEIIRSLELLPEERVDALHEQLAGNGLSESEARSVATAIRERVLPVLRSEERILLDGSTTTEPDDHVFHRPGTEERKNYGTTLDVLQLFVEYCEHSHGFDVC